MDTWYSGQNNPLPYSLMDYVCLHTIYFLRPHMAWIGSRYTIWLLRRARLDTTWTLRSPWKSSWHVYVAWHMYFICDTLPSTRSLAYVLYLWYIVAMNYIVMTLFYLTVIVCFFPRTAAVADGNTPPEWLRFQTAVMVEEDSPVGEFLWKCHPESRLNIKMSSYQYMDPHIKDKTVSRPSYL